MKWLILSVFCTLPLMAKAASSPCQGSSVTTENAEQVFKSCHAAVKATGAENLPQWMTDKWHACQFHRHTNLSKNAFESCVKDILQSTENVLSCPNSATRQQEAIDFDVVQGKRTFGSFRKVEVPAPIQQVFHQLTKVADRDFPARFGPRQWKLIGFEHKVANATAAADGTIYISEAFWKSTSPIYAPDEIAAVLAHEIGHTVQEHSLKLGCLAVEWIGPELNIEETTEQFREDLADGYPRKEAWKKLSQKFEYSADQFSTELMKRSGQDPLAMARALKNLFQKNGSGFSSGSHPELDARIEKIDRAVWDVLRKQSLLEKPQ